jgi:hypothetical protein
MIDDMVSSAVETLRSSKSPKTVWELLESAAKKHDIPLKRPLPKTLSEPAPRRTTLGGESVDVGDVSKRIAAEGPSIKDDVPGGMEVEFRNRLEASLYRLAVEDSDEAAMDVMENIIEDLFDSGFADDISRLGVDIEDVIHKARGSFEDAAQDLIDGGAVRIEGIPSIWEFFEDAAIDVADEMNPNAGQSIAESFVESLDPKSAKASKDALPEIATPRAADEFAEEVDRIKTENPDQAVEVDKMAEAFDDAYQKSLQGCFDLK